MKPTRAIKAVTAAKARATLGRMPTLARAPKLPTIPQHREKLAGMVPPSTVPRKGKS